MNVELVAVTEAEHDRYFAMLDVYHRELDRYDPDPWGDDRERLELHRRAVLADMEGRELLWIVAGGDRAGLAIVRTLPDWPEESRSIASIAEFYVVPERRRQGIGRAAVEALLTEHRRRGTYQVEAEILARNQPAQAFWAGLGFAVQSTVTARRP